MDPGVKMLGTVTSPVECLGLDQLHFQPQFSPGTLLAGTSGGPSRAKAWLPAGGFPRRAQPWLPIGKYATGKLSPGSLLVGTPEGNNEESHTCLSPTTGESQIEFCDSVFGK